MGRDLRSGGVNRFRVHASARLSITVRRWDDSTQSIGAGFRLFVFLFHCIRIYDAGKRAAWAILFGMFWSLTFSLGNCFPYITRLFPEGSEYLRIRNHNLFTLTRCAFESN
jgi:hypothetical protein